MHSSHNQWEHTGITRVPDILNNKFLRTLLLLSSGLFEAVYMNSNRGFDAAADRSCVDDRTLVPPSRVEAR